MTTLEICIRFVLSMTLILIIFFAPLYPMWFANKVRKLFGMKPHG